MKLNLSKKKSSPSSYIYLVPSGENYAQWELLDQEELDKRVEANDLKDGTQSVYDIYNNAVSQVAVDTRSTKANAETEESLLNSVKDQRASITGVNLEEEAANLIRYQQAYQAAAQIITTANDVFDTLLRATSR